MLSKAVVLEAFSLMFDWHKTFLPKVWNFNVYISCLWSMFSRGIISMPWFALPFLFCLLNVFSNNSVKKWKLRCKYCILKWRVCKLHIHARVVNIFGSGLKKHYPSLSDLPISFKNASKFAKCKTFDIDEDWIWFQHLQFLFLTSSVEINRKRINIHI